MKQQALYKIVGMQKDVADSAMDKQHAFDIRNMRFRHTGDNTVAALVNEEGNTPALDAQGREIQFVGTVIGCTTLNDTGIVFTHIDAGSTSDRIYLIDLDKNVNCRFVLFEYFVGNLNFSAEHPIECTVYFENEEIQKVYWVDGINPLRYANIADKNKNGNTLTAWKNDKMFDSVPELELNEKVTITRNDVGGVFPSGTIQWCFTYLNRYGAESNIVWTSPIYYSSPNDRGGKPGENCSNSFTITVDDYEDDGRFDYIRLYHIVHTSLDTEVEVRRIADIPISTDGEPITYTDTNTTGESVDPSELLYLGGISVIPKTLEQKSNTLFLGNLSQKYDYLREVLSGVSNIGWGKNNIITYIAEKSTVPADAFSGFYNHQNQLLHNSYNITSFQRGEVYRFGFQAQDKTGRWSDVWWLGDSINADQYPSFRNNFLYTVHAKYTIHSDVVTKLRNSGYEKVRPVVVYPEPWERNVITEGLLNPTVYNTKDRAGNAPFVQSSWFIRPFPPVDFASLGIGADWAGNFSSAGAFTDNSEYYPFSEKDYYSTATWSDMSKSIAIDPIIKRIDNGDYAIDIANYGSWAEFRHNHPLGDSQQRNGEIQSMYNRRPVGEVAETGSSWRYAKYRLTLPYVANTDAAKRDFVNSWADFFFVDQSIFTMHSADIEFDSTLQVTKFDDCSMRIVGMVPISSFISSYDITTNTPPNKFIESMDADSSLSIPQGLYGSEIIGATMDRCEFGWRSLISAALWHDEFAFNTIDDDYTNKELTAIGFAIYPWQGSGSLNNDSVGTKRSYGEDDSAGSSSRVGDNYISAELKEKTIANLHYSYRTHSVSDISLCTPINISAVAVLDEQKVSLTKLEPANNNIGTLHYFGSADKLITPVSGFIKYNDGTLEDRPLTRRGGYPRMASYLPMFMHAYDGGIPSHLAFYAPYSPISYWNTLTGVNGNMEGYSLKPGGDRSMSTISIRYKSGNHIAIALDYTEDHAQNCLGWSAVNSEIIRNTSYPPSSAATVPFWDNYTSYRELSVVSNVSFDGVGERYSADNETSFRNYTFDNKSCGFLYMGQLFRNSESIENRFGGNTDEAVEKNVWLPAGEAVVIPETGSVTITWSEGDTYYQRYDALRTYPFAEEDKNKVVDIVSFMTETHINIDGRYDKNRGLSNNNHCRPTNFNLLNMVYSQRDNFFTYHTLNPKKVNLDNFEYSFTWSLQKTAGSLRDEWTRVTLANTYDCDGNKGALTSINRLDNNLVAFQESGVSQILYNENVQIQGSEGVPIELANSGKVTGVRYFSTEIGCQNKWTISVFPNGIYWVDGRINEFCALGGNGIEQVSTTKLMSTWFKKQNDFIDEWRPSDWRGFISHRDIGTGEMFLTSNGTCLCYDTMMAEFTSLYDYNRTDAMFTIKGNTLTIADNKSGAATLWLHRGNKGEHCNFYGEQYPFSIEIVCNSNNQGSDYGLSKIFDNMSWRSDAWQWNNDDSWTYKPFITWTDMNGKNDYQTFSLHFDDVNGESVDDSKPQVSRPQLPLNLRKKFKVWYTTIPRSNESKTSSRPTGSDRIRDTWCHITLSADTSVSRFRQVIHDLSVTYFIP